jgi:PAS domain S-box-containing protein
MATGLQSLLENTAGLAHELLFEAASGGAPLLVNPAWSRVLGWNESELGAMSFYDLMHPDDLQDAREAVSRGVEHATAVPLEARVRGKDGAYRRISWNLLVQGDVLRGAGHDVTAQQALHPNHGGGSTIPNAKLAHDINNLLQNIIGALELIRMMQRTGRVGETERFMTSAIKSAHRAAELNQQRVGSFSAPAETTVGESAGP